MLREEVRLVKEMAEAAAAAVAVVLTREMTAIKAELAELKKSLPVDTGVVKAAKKKE
jgi:hypothetical protein